MAIIQLQDNLDTLIDEEDYLWARQFKWYAHKKERDNTWYVSRTYKFGGGLLHRLLLNATSEFEVDHIDGNGLNNQRSNLRLCTRKQNTYNTHRQVGISGYRGVTKHGKNWRAAISVDRRRIHLGTFVTPKEAASVYNDAASKYFGEFAVLNEV